MKRKYILMGIVLMLLPALIFPRETKAADPELIVTYSNISPIIDGSLRAEWNDTSRNMVNLTGDVNIETWVI